jgi:Ferric iron reductase FhuF-like transporter
MSGPLATALVAQLAELQRWFEGRLVPEPAPSDEVVPAERYRDLDFLRAAIARAHSTQASAQHYVGGLEMAEDEADIDLRIAVSRFTRQYASSISAVALVALARGVGLDLSARQCNVIVRSNVPFLVSLDLREDEVLRCAERPTTLPALGPNVGTLAELRGYVWRNLYAENFAPLFERARQVTKVSPRLMWTNAAEWVGLVSDTADEYLSPAAADPFVEDRIALLGAPSLPGVAGPNPLTGLLAWSDPTSDLPHGHHVRNVCCVTFYLPDRLGRLCANCPFLPAEDRLALVRERHSVPMGTPGGLAEQRAIELGLAKLGIAAR